LTWLGVSVDTYGDRRRQDVRPVTVGEPGQLATPVGLAAGINIEQPEHLDHRIGVDLDRLTSLVPVSGGHPVRPGQLSQIIGHQFLGSFSAHLVSAAG
jgi:hypothetical protein